MWFKLIAGASHTDISIIDNLVNSYANTGIDCIDIACEQAIVERVAAILAKQGVSPSLTIMVSIPLDPDAHFNKITLNAPDCILCEACIPACPADALYMSSPASLSVQQTACYGCNRCVPVCPTEALTLTPFLPKDLASVLRHSALSAVEIHTRYADCLMLQTFMTQYADCFTGKKISLCFSPYHASPKNWLACLRWLYETRATYDWILQIDGQPMSGTTEVESSRPALEGAKYVYETWCRETDRSDFPFFLTISGGINQHTAALLADYPMIQGVAMGTVARQYLKTTDPAAAAHALVKCFKKVQSLPSSIS